MANIIICTPYIPQLHLIKYMISLLYMYNNGREVHPKGAMPLQQPWITTPNPSAFSKLSLQSCSLEQMIPPLHQARFYKPPIRDHQSHVSQFQPVETKWEVWTLWKLKLVGSIKKISNYRKDASVEHFESKSNIIKN